MKLQTRCGRTINVTRFAPQGLPAQLGRVVLDTSFSSHDADELWASLTATEARRLAGLLLYQAAAVDPQAAEALGVVEVLSAAGDAYAIRIRRHELTVDQPLTGGGKDTAPAPGELLVAAVASCAAHCAGRFLDWHGAVRADLRVRAEFRMVDDRPARVASLSLTVVAPELPPEEVAALRAVVSHCTVTNPVASPAEMELRVLSDGGV
ncbi:OsmC family protein [Streptomyces sp. M92]|uniref:OsmC family protein n=1 Tax=Streptomyces sp. M92 TaxID=2944250 RepID=UPI00234BACC8|nr:OsmC family protein [Streptomyces sp. M92]WCN04076.1 OsmC family protein [Streptomyces sp. M92]